MSRLLVLTFVIIALTAGTARATTGRRSDFDTATGASPAVARQPHPADVPRTVDGLFGDPRPRDPDEARAVGEPPPSVFRPWDGVSTVVYDTQTRAQIDLGPGDLGRFSPDSTRMLWAATAGQPADRGEVRLIDLATMDWRPVADGYGPRWVDNDRIVFFESGGSRRIILDLRTDERREARPDEAPDFPDRVTPEGYVIRGRAIGTGEYDFLRTAYELVEAASGRTVITFEAYMAKPAGPGELVVATTPVGGFTNIFIVEIATGRATFIATSGYTAPNWPLAADAERVIWTDDYCGIPPGRTRLYDRRTGTLVELDRSDWVELTPGGLIAASPFGFGARWLLNPTTLEYVISVPGLAPGAPSRGAGDVAWSPDYRYAGRGFAGGHGSLCL